MGRKLDFEQKVLELELKVQALLAVVDGLEERVNRLDDNMDYVLDVLPDEVRDTGISEVQDAEEVVEASIRALEALYGTRGRQEEEDDDFPLFQVGTTE